MLKTSIILLLLAIIAGLLGFTRIARTSTTIARVLFVCFFVLLLAAIISYWYQM